jgi:hypothetical protein
VDIFIPLGFCPLFFKIAISSLSKEQQLDS